MDEKTEKKAKKKIQELWSRLCLEKLQDVDIYNRFLEKTRNVDDYGTKYFHTLQKVEKKPKDFKIVAFGVSRKQIIIVDAKTRKVKSKYPLEWVKAYAPQSKLITIDFGDHLDQWITLFTPHSMSVLAR